MTTKKKGVLATSKEWCKHLRFKRPFWKSERQAVKNFINKELQ
jgi:hypothetical protein